jgi:hypothetical protein
MRLARDLGYTLLELMQRMTHEELLLWNALYEAENQEYEQMERKLKRR